MQTPSIHMGLPSTETDFIEFSLDLNSYLVKNPTATYFMKLDTNAYARQGFFSKDILVIDRSKFNRLKPQVYQFENQFKIFNNTDELPSEAIFWGTVTGLIRKI